MVGFFCVYTRLCDLSAKRLGFLYVRFTLHRSCILQCGVEKQTSLWSVFYILKFKRRKDLDIRTMSTSDHKQNRKSVCSGVPETNYSLCLNKYVEMSKGDYELGWKGDALIQEPIFEQYFIYNNILATLAIVFRLWTFAIFF